MRYFVIGDDGQKYGPADVATLQSWVGEGRLLPSQQVEEEGSGIRMAASAVNGLVFPYQAQPQPMGGYQQPPGARYEPTSGGPAMGSNYNRPMAGSYGDDGKNDLIIAWVLFGFGVFFCLCGVILQPIAIVFANKAISKGNPGGNTARTLSIVFLVLSALLAIGYLIMIGMAVNQGIVPKQPYQQFPPR